MYAEASGDDRDLLRSEIDDAEARMAALEDELHLLLLPRDPNDEKNVIVEIRGAEGGEEANLFAKSLFEMYLRYADRKGWKVEVLGTQPSDMGGLNEVAFLVKADGAWPPLKHKGAPPPPQPLPAPDN